MRNFISGGTENEVLVKLIEGVSEQMKPRLKEAWEEPTALAADKTKELKKLLATEDKRELTKNQPNYFTRKMRALAALKDCIRYQSLNEQGNGSGSGLGMLYRGNTSSAAGTSLFATQHALRQDRRHRRSGSVKLGMKVDQTKENGHVSAFTPVKTRDLDIKILQEKTQQAEIKRKDQVQLNHFEVECILIRIVFISGVLKRKIYGKTILYLTHLCSWLDANVDCGNFAR